MTQLTPYEQRQVNQIAGWKAEPPALIVEAMDAVTHPIAQLAERYIPEQAVRDAIKIAYKDSEILTHPVEVVQRAQVANLHELRHGDLARCDTLAEHFARVSARKSAVRGSTLTGGPVLSMEVAIMYALKTVHTIGCCYGFTPKEPREKQYALQTLLVASAGSMKEKEQAIVNLRSLEDVLLEEIVEDVIEEEADAIIQQVVEEMAGSSVPLVGLAVGGVTNALITYQTAQVAKRLFQERWLCANGKVESIAPDPQFARTRLQRAEGVVSACFYWPSFLVSFVVTFPPILVTSLLPKNNVAVQGLVDGGIAASRDVQELSDRLREAFTFGGKTDAQPAALPAPAVA